MIPYRQSLLGDNIDVVGFACRVGAFLLNDLIDCLGDTPRLAGSLCRAVKDGLLSLEFDEKLAVVTETGLQAAGLSNLGPCRVRRYNALELIKGARFTMNLERLGYPVYGPRELQTLRSAGHDVPCPVLRETRAMKYTCSPGHLLQVDRDSDTRPISLQLVLQRGEPTVRLQEVGLALHRCDELAGVIYYVPAMMALPLKKLLADGGHPDPGLLLYDSDAAVDAVKSGNRFVIVGENIRDYFRSLAVSRLAHDFTRHTATTISYHAAVAAIDHALPEVHLKLYPGKSRQLIERVFAASLAGMPAPSPDSDVQVNFRATVWELANELCWHRAETGGESYEHTAERILELPLQESLGEVAN